MGYMEHQVVLIVLIVLVLAGGVAGYHYLVRVEQQKKDAENLAQLAHLIQTLDANPNDRGHQLDFLAGITGLMLPSNAAYKAFEKAFGVLRENLVDSSIQTAFLRYVSIVKWGGIDGAAAYKSVLGCLTLNSEPAVKQFLLDVARRHYANLRPDGKLTIYDEQAIQNDILMHSHS